MPYDPAKHASLESLHQKYGARLQSEARSRADGRPRVAGDDLIECYEDALATAHAVYAYLLAHPVRRIDDSSSELPDYSVEVVAP
jgi:hypothetical protein